MMKCNEKSLDIKTLSISPSDMESIYLDNFRGFHDSWIPIDDVTFCVGENSTGKSSFISIYPLIISMIWGNLDWDKVNLGGFSDMVSGTSENQNSFTVGRLICVNDRGTIQFGTFESDDGLPKLTRLGFAFKTHLIGISIDSPGGVFHTDIRSVDYGDNETQRGAATAYSSLFTRPPSVQLDTDELMQWGELSWHFEYALYIARKQIEKVRKGDPTKYKEAVEALNFTRTKIPNCIVIAPIRTAPKRFYDSWKTQTSITGEHVPFTIKKKIANEHSAEYFLKAISEVGTEGGIFRNISIKSHGNEAPFELIVELEGGGFPLSNVGYGVSQILPILVDGINSPPNTTIIIQQPEVHLHPRAQASLGGLFNHLATQDGKRFLIETHSDYIIDRFRLKRSKSLANDGHPPRAAVLYFARSSGTNAATRIEIHGNGHYDDSMPDAFRDFFIKEQMAMIKL